MLKKRNRQARYLVGTARVVFVPPRCTWCELKQEARGLFLLFCTFFTLFSHSELSWCAVFVPFTFRAEWWRLATSWRHVNKLFSVSPRVRGTTVISASSRMLQGYKCFCHLCECLHVPSVRGQLQCADMQWFLGQWSRHLQLDVLGLRIKDRQGRYPA